jgi:anti-sigma factor RsiW
MGEEVDMSKLGTSARPHPDQEWLLMWADGELAPESRSAMSRHLESCWQCRQELRAIEQTIDDAMKARGDIRRGLPEPPQPWANLAASLDAIDASLAPVPVWHRWAGALRLPRYALAFGAAAAVAALVFSGPFRKAPQVDVPAVVTGPKAEARPVEPEFPAAPAPRLSGTAAPLAESGKAIPDAGQVTVSLARVYRLLNEQGADLGAPVAVARNEAGVVVRSYGWDDAAAQMMESAVRRIPLASFERAGVGAMPRDGMPVELLTAKPGRSPMEQELRNYFGTEAAANDWLVASLDRVEDILLRAHALRRLDAAFPEGQMLPGESGEIVAKLRREHRQAVAAAARQTRLQLEPVLKKLGVLPQSTTQQPLFNAARDLEQALAQLAGAAPLLGPAEQLPGRIEAALTSLE